MTASVPPASEVARAAPGGDERFVEEMRERMPAELVLAEDLTGDRSLGPALDELEQDLWNDPCHFLRRACQLADYGTASAPCEPAEIRRAPR